MIRPGKKTILAMSKKILTLKVVKVYYATNTVGSSYSKFSLKITGHIHYNRCLAGINESVDWFGPTEKDKKTLEVARRLLEVACRSIMKKIDDLRSNLEEGEEEITDIVFKFNQELFSSNQINILGTKGEFSGNLSLPITNEEAIFFYETIRKFRPALHE